MGQFECQGLSRTAAFSPPCLLLSTPPAFREYCAVEITKSDLSGQEQSNFSLSSFAALAFWIRLLVRPPMPAFGEV